MTPDLRHELRQLKPFASLQQEAQLNLARTEAVLLTLARYPSPDP